MASLTSLMSQAQTTYRTQKFNLFLKIANWVKGDDYEGTVGQRLSECSERIAQNIAKMVIVTGDSEYGEMVKKYYSRACLEAVYYDLHSIDFIQKTAIDRIRFLEEEIGCGQFSKEVNDQFFKLKDQLQRIQQTALSLLNRLKGQYNISEERYKQTGIGYLKDHPIEAALLRQSEGSFLADDVKTWDEDEGSLRNVD